MYLCSGFGVNVTICGACAADLCEVGGGGGVRMSPYAVLVQRIWVRTAVGGATSWRAGKTRIFIESARFA